MFNSNLLIPNPKFLLCTLKQTPTMENKIKILEQ